MIAGLQNLTFDSKILKQAVIDAFVKLNPLVLYRNPIVFIIEIIAFITVLILIHDLFLNKDTIGIDLQISGWLWFTVLFANFAESIAEGRGRAQAATLRRASVENTAKLIKDAKTRDYKIVDARRLNKGDLVLVEKGDIIPLDGEVIEGIASVDESTVTGESAPVLRESGGDRSLVTGGTRVISDFLVIEIVVEAGESFIDKMIGMVEGAIRYKTPGEISLNIFLVTSTFTFLIVTVSTQVFAMYSGITIPVNYLGALFVTLIPSTIGGLLSAIGIAGMDRLVRYNVIAKSGRAVEAAGDISTVLLDKTGTITMGHRIATELIPAEGISIDELAEYALVASLKDETPEGKSILSLTQSKYNARIRNISGAEFIPFSAHTRMSGVDSKDNKIRKGAPDAILAYLKMKAEDINGSFIEDNINKISRAGGTALLVAMNEKIAGVIHLKDVIKPGIRDRFKALRQMGIRTVMITGDNPLTAAAVAAEAGVDDFLAEANPEAKMKLIADEQKKGKLVAMCGDGTNDAPALAKADLGLVMSNGTQAAREAGNMIDLDSDPTKLLEVITVGKQLLMTRGALTTFSIANDIAKYFAILPALFTIAYPRLELLNIMNLGSSESAILSAVMFNAIIIVFLIPLALRGVKYAPMPVRTILRNNVLTFGIGGLITPFAGIKLIDMFVNYVGLV